MKVLITGGEGMLGHEVVEQLSGEFEVASFNHAQCDICQFDHISALITREKPDWLINCAAYTNVETAESEFDQARRVNVMAVENLARICHENSIKLIHISTDCVFSGRNGGYTEDSLPDAEDVYGRSKHLGEVIAEDALTIRTSFVGREPVKAGGLVEWLLASSGGAVNGYINAIFSGFPSLHLARILADIIADHPDLQGLYHVSSEPIDKYRLLVMINDALGLNVDIRQHADFHCDRSLD
ncbi:SDR family oxidoreductase, partial [PVC group bacterium]|nr:SDR family oxidoreductase [PVC group bacterium]